MRLRKLLLPAMALISLHAKIIAQDTTRAEDTTNLMNQLEKEADKNKTAYTTSTFEYTRIINGQSVENLPAHVLDVRISHRFGPLSKGVYEFFGLDYSPFNVRVGFDYGITNNLMIGVGHNAWQKTYDAFIKIKILKQSAGAVNMPVTASLVSTFAINTVRPQGAGFDFSDTMAKKIDRASYDR